MERLFQLRKSTAPIHNGPAALAVTADAAVLLGIPGLYAHSVNAVRITDSMIMMCISPRCTAQRALPPPPAVERLKKGGKGTFVQAMQRLKFSQSDHDAILHSFHYNLSAPAVATIMANNIDGPPNLPRAVVSLHSRYICLVN
jgi:hypothetical protein